MRCALGLALAGALLAAGASEAQAGPRFVSLGSSYAAGPGVGRRDPSSGGCARSLDNYARRLAARRGLELVDAACSGAVTANILDHGQFGQPPQIEAVDADTPLVAVTIGGNDVGYVADLMGYSCRTEGLADCRVKSAEEVEQGFAALAAAMQRVATEVRRRAPEATLVFIAYPMVLPAHASAACRRQDPLIPSDAELLRRRALRLESITRDAAKTAHAVFVSSEPGHDVCAASPWVAGFRPAVQPGWPRAVPWHPTAAGMAHTAEAVEAALDRAGFWRGHSQAETRRNIF